MEGDSINSVYYESNQIEMTNFQYQDEQSQMQDKQNDNSENQNNIEQVFGINRFILQMYFQQLSDEFSITETLDPDVHKLERLPKCVSGGNRHANEQDDCATIAYAIIGQKEVWIDYVMQHVSHYNNLTFSEDVIELQETKPDKIYNYFQENQNKTQIAVIFCTSEWQLHEDYNFTIPCTFQQEVDQKMLFYTMVYNWTLHFENIVTADSWPKDPYQLRLKSSIDSAIAYFYGKYDIDIGGQIQDDDNKIEFIPGPEHQLYDDMSDSIIDIDVQDYPYAPNRMAQGTDATAIAGAFYFFCPFMIQFVIMINTLLTEKEKKLRYGLSVMGMTHYAYWISWFITQFLNSFIICFVLVCSGKFLDFNFFVNTPFYITFLYFLVFSLSIQSIACFIYTISPNSKSGQTIGYGFLLLAIVMQLFLSSPMLLRFLYMSDADGNEQVYQVFLRRLFSIYPAFHFSKIYHDISSRSSNHLSIETGQWEEGNLFTYEDLFVSNREKFFQDQFYEIPSSFNSFINLLLTQIMFWVLTIYCDNVFPNNRGKQESVLFFLNKDYWQSFFSSVSVVQQKRKLSNINSHKEVDYNNISMRDTVLEEKNRVLKNIQKKASVKGLRIQKLQKIYRKYPFGIKSIEDFEALKGVYLEVEENELLSILGKNGAGKSTLINVLTGILESTDGEVEMLDYNIKDNLDQIRSQMGVCPQFDILWDELTAGQHLRFFCLLKGIKKEYINQEIEKRLKEVELSHIINNPIKTLSGGMKRRISLAISAIGNPKIIFMDEPTTGMDPKTKRGVWQMIKNFKKNKAVILTTHDMQEAEALSERIAVINEGNFKCIGTSLFLKNNFGDGYRINLICEPLEQQFLIQNLQAQIKDLEIIDQSSGGSILASIPLKNMDGLNLFFEIMEGKHDQDESCLNIKQLVQDWGLSHATLEEVFMQIQQK